MPLNKETKPFELDDILEHIYFLFKTFSHFCAIQLIMVVKKMSKKN